MSQALSCSVKQRLAARGVCGQRGVNEERVDGLLQHWDGLQYGVSIHSNKSNLISACVLWLQVRVNVVAITLDVSEEEIHFQFGMGNWSSYVDQVYPSFPFLALPIDMPCLPIYVTRQAFLFWFKQHQLHLVCLSAADI